MALLKETMRLGQMYEDSLLKTEAAFRAIGRPLPLFPDIDRRRDDEEGR